MLATVSPTPTLAVVSDSAIEPPLERVKVTPTELVAATTPVWLVKPFTVATKVDAPSAFAVLKEIATPFNVNV